MSTRSNMQMKTIGWGRLAAIIVTSTIIMFFLMYQLVYESDHLFFSLNRLLASVVAGFVMTVVMLAFMWSMYEGQATKAIVLVGAAVLALVLLYVNRSQAMIDDARAPGIDDERDDIARDLSATGLLADATRMQLVPPEMGTNAFGEPFFTYGQAIVAFLRTDPIRSSRRESPAIPSRQ